jgi:hypothetical protein
MVTVQRDVPIVLMVVGLGLSTVGADLVSSQRIAVGFVLGGSALAWGTILVMALFLDDRAWGRLMSDERMSRLTFRAGAVAWMSTLATLVTFAGLLDYADPGITTQYALLGAAVVAIGSFVGALGYYSRQM